LLSFYIYFLLGLLEDDSSLPVRCISACIFALIEKEEEKERVRVSFVEDRERERERISSFVQLGRSILPFLCNLLAQHHG
jgi:hypothetical protein